MTELSKKILENYQVRKSPKQKKAFISLMKTYFPQMQVQEGGFPKSRNLIIGDVEKADVWLTAHYDTCAWMPLPNLITPKAPLYTILYSIVLYIPIFAVVLLLNLLMGVLFTSYPTFLFSFAASVLLLLPMFFGPANLHTANDNTSGVITLCELLRTLSAKQRKKVAFIFFDNEELGMLGSAAFRRKYKAIADSKLVINFDCVSDGDHIMVAASKEARASYGQALDDAFVPTEEKSILLSNAEKVYYPSDQAMFRQGVAVAALKKAPIVGYYMDRIHTHRDTVFDKANIKLLCESILKLLKTIA